MNMNLQMNVTKKGGHDKGFTLLELLIVISIIAVLSVALVLVLNPAEALRKARDSQRISDLNTMKTALGLYMTSTTTPYLGARVAGALNNTRCKLTPLAAWDSAGTPKIFYSLPTTGGSITQSTLDSATGTGTLASQTASVTAAAATDGSGWIPVAFDNLTGGSPISNLPIDPTNAIISPDTVAGITKASLMYRYACSVTPLAFEIDASLESAAYTVNDDKLASDGGGNASFYEVGINLKIMGTGNNF